MKQHARLTLSSPTPVEPAQRDQQGFLLSIALIALALALPLVGCDRPTDDPHDGNGHKTLDVFVSIPPQVEAVRRIGGDRVNVQTLVGAGQNPHSFAPTAKQMARLREANALFRIGMPFEDRLLEKLHGSMGSLNVVDVRKGITLRQMDEGDDDHDHDADHDEHAGHDHDHDHEGADPHVWMSPKNMALIAGTVCDELCRLSPKDAETFRANLAAYRADLKAADDEIARQLAPLRGQTLLVYHPAFGYFADAYGLKQKAVEIEGKSPSAKALAHLIDDARKDHIRVIFLQAQFDPRLAERVAREVGGAVVSLDPLAEDYLTNLRRIATAIQTGLQPGN